jgi:hypothetical protein
MTTTEIVPGPVNETACGCPPDPRDVFLTRKETYVRYRKHSAVGYALLLSPGFPPDCNGKFRLDMLREHEEGAARQVQAPRG